MKLLNAFYDTFKNIPIKDFKEKYGEGWTNKYFNGMILSGSMVLLLGIAGGIFGAVKGCQYTLQKVYPETFTEEGIQGAGERKKLRRDLYSKIAGEDKILEPKDLRRFLDYLGDTETVLTNNVKLSISDPFVVQVYEIYPKPYKSTEQDSYFVKALTQEQVENYLKSK
jgi:hypothetical protein